jgi:hypothetical protein
MSEEQQYTRKWLLHWSESGRRRGEGEGKGCTQFELVTMPRIVLKPKETKRQSSSTKLQLLLCSTAASKPEMLCAVADVTIKLVLGGVYGYYHSTSAPDSSPTPSLSNSAREGHTYG